MSRTIRSTIDCFHKRNGERPGFAFPGPSYPSFSPVAHVGDRDARSRVVSVSSAASCVLELGQALPTLAGSGFLRHHLLEPPRDHQLSERVNRRQRGSRLSIIRRNGA
jgi:hypothetical protein